MEVELAAALVLSPRRSAELRLPVIGRGPVGLWVVEVVQLPVRIVGRRQSSPKPGMLVRCVVRDKVDQDLDLQPVRLLYETIEVRQGPVLAVDVKVIGDVV